MYLVELDGGIVIEAYQEEVENVWQIINGREKYPDGLNEKLLVIQSNSTKIKITNGKNYIQCEDFQFYDLNTLTDMLEHGIFQLNHETAVMKAKELIEQYQIR